MGKLAVVMAFCFGSCLDTTAPYWVTKCTSGRTVVEQRMAPMGCGMDMMTGQLKCGAGMIWVTTSKFVCDKTERVCAWGKDYAGEKVCHG